RNPRLRLACARCQRRKIRCDGQYPTCSNCRKAEAQCVDGDSIRLRTGPHDRSNAPNQTSINRLRRRITWLESIIRQRLPDVDLSRMPPADVREGFSVEDGAAAEGSGSEVPQEQRDTPLPNVPLVRSAQVLDQRTHEIGLLCVDFNADQRYIGPSSGYFLARLLFANSPAIGEPEPRASRLDTATQSSINDLVSAVHGPLPLPSKHVAIHLCQIYFETIQPQYPILHEGSFYAALDQIYCHDALGDAVGDDDPSSRFQVYIVLAISATISAWRTKQRVPGESYCISALRYLDRISVGTSLVGLQCMLLLLIFTMYSPHMRLSVWHLNYQCLAAVVELGLQRQVTTLTGISLLEQELRTRIFWTVFTLDRTIASMMGRPIGLRDEACDLRLPHLLGDSDLVQDPRNVERRNCNMAASVHLFKLAKLNSEIKYVANSIVRDVPSYAYPPIHDVSTWQSGMLQQLDDWATAILQMQSPNEFITVTSELRYLSVKMLLLRPSPAIPNPTSVVLTTCHASARRSLQLYESLYKKNLIVHDWITLHGVVFSTITLLYCTRAVSEIAQKVELEELMEDMSVSLSILSATGEHWSGVKRVRDILEDVGKSTMRWLRRSYQTSARRQTLGQEQSSVHLPPTVVEDANQTETLITGEGIHYNLPELAPNLDLSPGIQFDHSLFPELQQHQEPFGDTANIDEIMRHLFNDLIP
ncbi:hypothetical protein IQ06DRAFT_199439, partial [Phaeosphaeriaceae sp. SRC1lsM3a]